MLSTAEVLQIIREAKAETAAKAAKKRLKKPPPELIAAENDDNVLISNAELSDSECIIVRVREC